MWPEQMLKSFEVPIVIIASGDSIENEISYPELALFEAVVGPFGSLFAFGRMSLGLSTARTVPALIFDACNDVSPNAKKLIALYPF